jgi:Holliday junction resolvasome RuvABC endonuclease subunit
MSDFAEKLKKQLKEYQEIVTGRQCWLVGVDPGLANMGLFAINTYTAEYVFITVSTNSKENLEKRLNILSHAFSWFLPDITNSVFSEDWEINQQITNKQALQVLKVCGLVRGISYGKGISFSEQPTKTIKSKLGCLNKLGVEETLKFFGLNLRTSHEYDAAACVIAGISQAKRRVRYKGLQNGQESEKSRV